MGYVPIEAGTVAGAISIYDAELPPASLLDINLPDGSCLDALREIKDHRANAVVMMITGNVHVQNTISALRGGAYDFIGKHRVGTLRLRKGAFTDAKAGKEGMFEQAEGGTLFLDEIGELELGLQAKLLRVLEEGAFRRVGGLKDIALDVRVVVASNRDLKTESEAGRFRLGLYYRLSVIQIDIPPLRERGDDVLVLAQHYISMLGERLRLRKKIRGLAPEVAEAFRCSFMAGQCTRASQRERACVDSRRRRHEYDGASPARYFVGRFEESCSRRAGGRFRAILEIRSLFQTFLAR